MSRTVKFTPKELKKPDRFRESVAKAIFIISENYKKLLIALGIIIIALAGILIGIIIQERSELAVNSFFRKAMSSYQEGKYDEALNKFLALIKEYPNADVSKIALFYAAIINYNSGKYDNAISLFNDFIKSDVKDQMLKDAAYLNIGTASFDKGNWKEAIDYLSKLDKKNNPYRNQAKLYIALSLEKLGKNSEAETIYKELYNNQNLSNDLKFDVQ
jgi:TolA-binding protein